MSILKPFLPSEVSAVIRSVEEYDFSKEVKKEVSEEKKDDFLLSLNDDLNFDLEEKKVDLKKETPLKKVEKVELKEVKEVFPSKEPNLKDNSTTKLKPKKENELFDLDLDIDLNSELFVLDDKGTKKIDETELLDFDLESNDELDLTLESTEKKREVKKVIAKEVVVENPKKIVKKDTETKILDKVEVANIKEILENKNQKDVELKELIIPSVPVNPVVKVSENIKEKKKKSKKEKKTSDTLAETLSSLPVESLKGLLAGANIKINIKFPKDK
jgi:hypothetical protein